MEAPIFARLGTKLGISTTGTTHHLFCEFQGQLSILKASFISSSKARITGHMDD